MDDRQKEILEKLYDQQADKDGYVPIGIEHAEFCIRKHNYYQVTRKRLLCSECSRTGCVYHGLTCV